ncbi:hypothetical protein Scep_015261 [Stephania cephalantha]|uniref:Uncharacterized protein n=1 Tax=Stephania cephalantha TaxID=152367 RepID=A0AAP0P2M6_9MAGN
MLLVFGNDRATGEDAFDVVEELGGDNGYNSENGSDPIASEDVEVTRKGLFDRDLLHRRLLAIQNKREKRHRWRPCRVYDIGCTNPWVELSKS